MDDLLRHHIVFLNELERQGRLAKVKDSVIAELAEIGRGLKTCYLAELEPAPPK